MWFSKVTWHQPASWDITEQLINIGNGKAVIKLISQFAYLSKEYLEVQHIKHRMNIEVAVRIYTFLMRTITNTHLLSNTLIHK